MKIPETNKKRVVIVGGGFAGLNMVNSLNKELFQVVLIDRNNYHQFQPLLYQVASSGLEPSSICFPFRKIFRKPTDFFIRLAEVTRIDTAHNYIDTSIGALSYDYLVIAAGTTTNFYGNQSLQEKTLPMKTVEEAMLVRNRLLLNLEAAAIADDEKEREKHLNVVVVGGGATGVEVAGVLSEMKRFVIPRDFPDLNGHNLSIRLIEGSTRLLGALSEESSAAATRFLEKMGVEILLNQRVVGYEEDQVMLHSGMTIPSKTVIWVSGVQASPIDGLTAEVIGPGGRILVDPLSRVLHCSNLFAIGDIALMRCDDYPNGHPQVAQPAIQQARTLSLNLEAIENNRPTQPFQYNNLGSLATIGRNKAVADIWKLHFNGFPAWLIWMVVHLRSILGVKNKIAVLFDWIWNYISYHQSIRLILFRGKRE